jgi:hypothetical protein
LGTSFQALAWWSVLDEPAQVVPAPAAQSFWPLRATPKHFSVLASLACTPAAMLKAAPKAKAKAALPAALRAKAVEVMGVVEAFCMVYLLGLM